MSTFNSFGPHRCILRPDPKPICNKDRFDASFPILISTHQGGEACLPLTEATFADGAGFSSCHWR
ncbi:MAG: hypothetical protein ACM3N3_17825, partial [Betaproteobacteria bacterium]